MRAFVLVISSAISSLCAFGQSTDQAYTERIEGIIDAGKTGDFKRAVELGRSAIKWADLNKQDSALAVFSFFTGMGYNELSVSDSALHFLQIADSCASRNNYIKLQIRTKLIIIDLYQLREGNLKKAMSIIEEVKPLAEQLGDKNYLMRLESKVAFNEKEMLHYQKALKHYINYLNMCIEIKDEINEGLANQNIGVLLSDLKQYDQSIEYYLRAIALCNKVNHQHRTALIYNNLASAYLSLEKFDSAQHNFEKAITIAEQYDDKATKASAEHGLASVAISRSLLQEDDNKTSKNSGGVNHESQQANLEEVLDQSRKLNQKRLEGEALIGLGREAFIKKQYKESETHYLHALEVCEQIDNKQLLLSITKKLSELYQETNNFKKAFHWQSIASAYQDSLYEEASLRTTLDLEARYQSARKEKEIEELKAKEKLLQLEEENRKQKYLLGFGGTSILILTIGLTWYYRNRQKILKKDAELSHLNQRILETRQVALRAQMNPHFIFNLIGTIDGLILKNERHHASELLTSFANLVRMILQNSEKSQIDLHDEVESVRQYLLIEQHRHGMTFAFSLDVDKEIDLMVPPLILQPFVENAIVHGLAHSDRPDKKIAITIQQPDTRTIDIKVIDNGIGLKKSAELNSNKRQDHTSMGTRITQDRLQLWHTTKGIQTEVSIQDRVGDSGVVVHLILKGI